MGLWLVDSRSWFFFLTVVVFFVLDGWAVFCCHVFTFILRMSPRD